MERLEIAMGSLAGMLNPAKASPRGQPKFPGRSAGTRSMERTRRSQGESMAWLPIPT
ncbi:hypothetical protein M3223_17225 [Paenibacillus pasadenensis]|uniref:hypothetical protein n=1 Tax=Paenibacillus pasadenensis TaxID=217090 RepID=UPI00203E42B8|nr:hypothetical protein [Paenibacillus pasadenensis]MCM3749101.1 hypothetical protein [Paenibacillus pasadenensis]